MVEATRFDPAGEAARRGVKSPTAFRTISEVATDLDVPQHVLRFWETRFAQIRPLKRAGGRRYYRPEDVDLLRRIRELLYRSGYTIRGVQKLLREPGRGASAEAENDAAPPPQETVAAAPPQPARPAVALDKNLVADVLAELEGLREELRFRRGPRGGD